MVSSSGICAKRVVVDALHHMLGRLASILAKELLNGQRVVVVRCEEICLSGGLVRQKMKYLRLLRRLLLRSLRRRLRKLVELFFLMLVEGSSVRVQGDEFWHMTKVLRLNIDDRVELFNGKGGLVEGCIQNIDRTGLDLVALENPKLVSPQSTQWHVIAAFGTLKGGRADWLVEKCTELGANSVTPLLTERSPSISENRVDRLDRVNLAAAKQCQRLHEMTLKPPIKINELLPLVAQSQLSLLAVAEASPVLRAVSSMTNVSSGLLIIGPEGDFTRKEMDMIMEAGAMAVGLGPHRLRVETATVALLSTLMLWSDSQEMSNN